VQQAHRHCGKQGVADKKKQRCLRNREDDVMNAALLIATVLTAQNPVLLDADPLQVERIDAAYEELADGDTQRAIAQLEAMGALTSNDPALLINLGSAYARMGRTADARALFTRARDAREHYDLELAGGAWVDSRRAATLALAQLNNRPAMAAR
jgi:Flp pilus assembly protein TadD